MWEKLQRTDCPNADNQCVEEPETESGLVVTERTILLKTKKDLKSAGVVENLTTEVAENKFAAKYERF